MASTRSRWYWRLASPRCSAKRRRFGCRTGRWFSRSRCGSLRTARQPAEAFHPQCHPDAHEERGYAHRHGLHADLLGSRERLPTPDDLEAIRELPAAALLELPARELGGHLPPWEELTAFCAKRPGPRDRALWTALTSYDATLFAQAPASATGRRSLASRRPAPARAAEAPVALSPSFSQKVSPLHRVTRPLPLMSSPCSSLPFSFQSRRDDVRSDAEAAEGDAAVGRV
jgi:hypothetical protein